MKLLGNILVTLILVTFSFEASGETSPDASFLRIETGMHTGMINRLAYIPDTNEIITVSDDKTARVWDYKGKLLWVLRPPVGNGDRGAIYAVAATNKLVALGGRTVQKDKNSVYFFSIKKKKFIGSLNDLVGTVTALSFSKDGKYLAVGLSGKGGLKVYNLKNKKVILTDNGHAINSIDFSYENNIATTASDNRIRTYKNFQRTGDTELPDNANPWKVSFSPDGKKIAVGSSNTPNVFVYNFENLELDKTFSFNNKCFLSAVSWQGHSIFAGGNCKKGSERLLVKFDSGQKTFTAGKDTVTDIITLPDSNIAYTTAEPSFGILDSFKISRKHADFRDMNNRFKVSDDGSVIEFNYAKNEPAVFSLFNRKIANSTSKKTKSPNQGKISEWKNLSTPLIDGTKIKLGKNEKARSLSKTGNSFVLGTDFYLRKYDNGHNIKWKTLLPSPAWALNHGGRFIIVALGDGTIRWYEEKTGKEQIALFPHKDKRWILWTPEGFFDHSYDAATGFSGSDLVGYHINRKKGTDFINVEQLYNTFYRRDMVMAKFRGDETISKQTSKTGKISSIVEKTVPPAISLEEYCIKEKCHSFSKDKGITVADNSIKLRLKIKDNGSGAGEIIIRRNGTLIENSKQSKTGTRTEEHTVPLHKGNNSITVSAFTPDKKIETSSSQQIKLNIKSEIKAKGKTLYVISIGISEYALEMLELENAARDAKAVAKTMEDVKGSLYQKADSQILLNNDVSIKNIEKAFEKVSQKSSPDDMVLLFLAGHGLAVDGQYHFAPYNLGVKSKKALDDMWQLGDEVQQKLIENIFKNEGLSQSRLIELLRKIKASRMVVLLDTCYSGAFASLDATLTEKNDTWVNTMGRQAGRFILAGATAKQEALDSSSTESDDAGHGLFTHWLLAALKGKADRDNNHKINIYELATYTKENVIKGSEQMEYRQDPSFYFSGTDFFDVKSVD